MAHQVLREKAIHLRKNGVSINDISARLQASKSTVSYWCRDIVLSPRQIRALAHKQERGGMLGRLRAAEVKRDKRLASVALQNKCGRRDVGTMSKRDIFILGLALYWGEGFKRGNDECGISNSDPAIIIAFIEWVRSVYNVKAGDLIARVSLNRAHTPRVTEVERYWAKTTGIPLKQFTRTSLIKSISKKEYSNQRTHYGTLRVKIRRGTNMRRRILGSIAEVSKQLIRSA